MKRRGFALILIPLSVFGFSGCQQSPPSSPAEVTAVHSAKLPSDLNDPIWGRAPVHVAPLLLQDMVEPRLMEASTTQVSVQAVSDGSRVSILLQWEDAEQDDLPGPGRFSDACAVQFPLQSGPDAPAPQMGEPGKPVEITYWSAAWQALVDGRTDSIQAIYPGATVDHYPFQAPSLAAGSPEKEGMVDRYAPARALGNDVGMGRHTAVQQLIATGPGTLRPAPTDHAEGSGHWSEKMWKVTLSRPLPASLRPGQRSVIAFAVWQGSHNEVGARKMRTGWVPFHLEEEHGNP